VLRLANRGF